MTDNSVYDMPPSSAAMTAAVSGEIKPERSFTRIDGYFAVLFLFAGFAFVKLRLLSSGALSAAIFGLAVFASAGIYVKLSGAKPCKQSKIFYVLAVIFLINLAITDNVYIRFFDTAFTGVLFAVWAFTLNNSGYKGADDNLVYMLLSAVFGQSFGNIGSEIKAVSNLTKGSRTGKTLRNVLLGLVIAVPVTLVVAALLTSADDNFDRFFSDIMGNIFGNSIGNIITFVVMLPMSFLMFGMLYSAVSSKGGARLDTDKCEQKTDSFKIAPQTVIYSSITPLCIIYVMFFVSQISYFVSAFANRLPEQFSASEYARKGFFELCAVAVINLGVIALINLLCSSKDGKRPKALSVFTSLLSVFTIVLIATALSKMVMYIYRFGMTRLRLYTSWFMVLLAVLFVLIVLRQFVKINIAKLGTIIFTIMFAVLCFVPTDALIARYNIYAYESGWTERLDMNYLNKLSCDATYAVKPLLESENAELKAAGESFIGLKSEDKVSWKEINLSYILTQTRSKNR